MKKILIIITEKKEDDTEYLDFELSSIENDQNPTGIETIISDGFLWYIKFIWDKLKESKISSHELRNFIDKSFDETFKIIKE